MDLSLKCRCWSVLQVVAIVLCHRGNVSSEREEGCVGSRLMLRCPEMKLIEVTDVVVGDSDCSAVNCCIKDTDCTDNANANHTADVHSRCDGQSICTVDVIKEKINCWYFGAWSNNDFEYITYDCINDPQNDTTSSTVAKSEGGFDQKGGQQDDGGMHDGSSDNSSSLGIVIICVVCLIVIIAVVASVSVVTVRRKKRPQVKCSDAIKKSELDTNKQEAIYVNDAARTSLHENAASSVPIYINSGAKNFETPTSDYCELEGVAAARIQCDSQYEQLDHGRNYEPLVVYEQLQ